MSCIQLNFFNRLVVSSMFNCNLGHLFYSTSCDSLRGIVVGCRFESQSVFECRYYKRNFVVYGSLLTGMFISSLRFCISSLLTSLCMFFLGLYLNVDSTCVCHKHMC